MQHVLLSTIVANISTLRKIIFYKVVLKDQKQLHVVKKLNVNKLI